MSERLAYIWHHSVQPKINANYKLASGKDPEKMIRADVDWNWVKLLYLAGLHNLVRIAGQHGSALAMCIVVDTGATGHFPIGMLTTIPLFHCLVLDERRRRGFGWFLADAPIEVYQFLKVPAAKGVALALLDCGIQAALDKDQDGSFLLHASPEGGDKLLKFYEQKVGMQRLSISDESITRIFRRSNTDQYFYLDDIQSRVFTSGFDTLR